MAKEKSALVLPTRKEGEDQKDNALGLALESIRKDIGPGAVMMLGDKPLTGIDAISTGSLRLDIALGIGGLPRGRVVEIYGPESCLDKDTFVQFEVRSGAKRSNHKGGSIERLYERFHKVPRAGKGFYRRPQTADAEFLAPSVNDDGRIFQNRIVDVVKTGAKEIYRVTTRGGLVVQATAEHKFFTGSAYVPLCDLAVGSTVQVHVNTPYRVAEAKMTATSGRRYWYVRQHPVAGVKVVLDPDRGYSNTYCKLARSRAVVEARMNGLTLGAYRILLNSTADLSGLQFLSRDQHVHHLDEDCTNDSESNLVVLSAEDHGREHAVERHNNLRYAVTEDVVTGIDFVGVEETYDLRMESPYNNYVANGFVVHNSGKTTVALHAVANAQAAGGRAAYIDVEHSLDPEYAGNLKVDINRLVVSQPDTGEQALEICDRLVRSGTLDIIVIDSVAALVPRAELEGEMGDSHVGLQARLMGQALRKLTPTLASMNTMAIFINQLREKIGITYGSPETTPGGKALKYYASVRIDVRRIAAVKDGTDVTANETRAKVIKNKVAPPMKIAEFQIRFGEGIDKVNEIITMGIDAGLVKKGGAWYSTTVPDANGEMVELKEQGAESFRARLLGIPSAVAFLEAGIKQSLGAR